MKHKLSIDLSLQAKVGKGKISEHALRKSRKIVKEQTFDFKPIAQELMTQIKELLHDKDSSSLDDFITPVMQLKANASMFGYDIISQLSAVMLHTLETIESKNEILTSIIKIYHNMIATVIKHDIRTDDKIGKIFQKELNKVSEYYLMKHSDRATA